MLHMLLQRSIELAMFCVESYFCKCQVTMVTICHLPNTAESGKVFIVLACGTSPSEGGNEGTFPV